ncbi:hypothetical protein B0T14DRAFT_286161 [Immersiella caudata]|uniref:Uncharacterized protein n=1 Tax=Immersiella caudata TaxID=314043 RepID=A0AA39WEB4_9PEZI|nr:hypothetical protein B0T14DRAFT_286161 [Immersiella caudata]
MLAVASKPNHQGRKHRRRNLKWGWPICCALPLTVREPTLQAHSSDSDQAPGICRSSFKLLRPCNFALFRPLISPSLSLCVLPTSLVMSWKRSACLCPAAVWEMQMQRDLADARPCPAPPASSLLRASPGLPPDRVRRWAAARLPRGGLRSKKKSRGRAKKNNLLALNRSSPTSQDVLPSFDPTGCGDHHQLGHGVSPSPVSSRRDPPSPGLGHH